MTNLNIYLLYSIILKYIFILYSYWFCPNCRNDVANVHKNSLNIIPKYSIIFHSNCWVHCKYHVTSVIMFLCLSYNIYNDFCLLKCRHNYGSDIMVNMKFLFHIKIFRAESHKYSLQIVAPLIVVIVPPQ